MHVSKLGNLRNTREGENLDVLVLLVIDNGTLHCRDARHNDTRDSVLQGLQTEEHLLTRLLKGIDPNATVVAHLHMLQVSQRVSLRKYDMKKNSHLLLQLQFGCGKDSPLDAIGVDFQLQRLNGGRVYLHRQVAVVTLKHLLHILGNLEEQKMSAWQAEA
jgi:hypothetical protein